MLSAYYSGGLSFMKSKILRSLTLLLTVITFASCFCLAVSAAEAKTVKSGDFIFSVGNSSASLVEYTGNAEAVKIPEKINGKKVTAIGDYAFWQKNKMKSITIPDSVKTIGVAAFNECTALKKVVFPESLKTVKDSAFWYCKNLQTVLINKNAKSFGKNVFKYCNKLTVYVYEGTKGETFAKGLDGVKVGYRAITALKASSQSVQLGSTVQAKVTVTPSVVYNSKLKYSSSDKKILTVNSKGVITPVKCGTAYVTATTTDGSKKSVKFKVTVTPQQVTTIKQSKTTATSYRLSWQKSVGADYYRVSEYNEKTKKWVVLKNTSKTYYDIKDRTPGSSAKYRVRAYCKIDKKEVLAPVSKTFTATVLIPSKVSSLAVSAQSANSITLKWAKAQGAQGYAVYSFDGKTYKLLGKTTALSYTVKNLTANSSYTYCVKAYLTAKNKTVYSKEYSAKLTAYTSPAAVSALTLDEKSITSDKFTLSWKAPGSVSGYEVAYKAQSESAWKTLKTASTSLTLQNLESGVLYSVKVRAYKTHGKTTLYGAYSGEIKAETAAVPKTAQNALDAFSAALDSAYNCKDSYMIKVTAQYDNFYEKTLDDRCTAVFEDIAQKNASKTYYSFENGKDVSTQKTLKEIISPDASEDFRQSDVALDKITYTMDGSGFSLAFPLADKNADKFTPAIDWTALEEKHGFTLESVQYETNISNTKIQNGRFDNLKATVDFTAQIQFGEEVFTLTGTLSYFYMFIWN